MTNYQTNHLFSQTKKHVSQNRSIFTITFCAVLILVLLGTLFACNTKSNTTSSDAKKTDINSTEVASNLEKIAETTLKTAQTFETAEELTTFGGADIDTPQMTAVQNELNSILSQGKSVSFVVINTLTQKGFSYNADKVCVAKSTIKAPYLTSLIINDQSVFNSSKEEIKKVITYSDNQSYRNLRAQYGNEVFQAFCEKAGVEESKTTEYFPLNMTVRDMAKLWSLMYPTIKGNYLTDSALAEYSSYFICTAYSPFSTLLWRDNIVFSKAGWDEGITIDDNGLLEKAPQENMIDGDPLNNETALNDTGIVCAQNGDYIFAYFSDYPAISDLMYPLIQAIHEAEVAMG